MTGHPIVSVLMTSYNREKFIGEAIASVLASTFKDFELIIVDDCSKDGTVGIARAYEQADPRIKVYVNEQNLGDYNNRNKAASYATGTYIKYWDSDDVMYPHCLDVMLRSMLKYPEAGLGLIKPHLPYFPDPYPFAIQKPFETFSKHQDLFSNSPGSAIMRRDVFNRVGGFSGKRYIGDFEFWLKISQHTPLVIIPGFLGWDRTHPGQERDFDEVAYEKLAIDALSEAFANSKLENIEELKMRVIGERVTASKKIIAKNLLRLNFSAAMRKFKLLTYLQQKTKD